MEHADETTRTLPRGWRRKTGAQLEALSAELNEAGEYDLMEEVEAELERREDEDEEPHEDSPSLQDRGLYLGSYGS